MNHVVSFLSSLQLGDPAGTPDLTVFPLVAPNGHDPSYDTLKDAIAAGHTRVTEVSLGGSVPDLRVVNEGTRPVLIMDGEELIGAKQNRIVNISILVPPRATITIPVSCVEAGRWHARSSEFASADRAYYASGRRAKVEQVSESLRHSASRCANQGEIWADIDAKSARFRVASATREAGAMYEHARDKLDAFIRQLQPVNGQIGAVFAIRGAIVGLDAFDCSRTWARMAPGLVRSYGLDALDAAVGGSGFARPDPRQFLEAITKAGVESFPAIGLGTDLRLRGAGIVGGSLVADGGVVHLVAFPTQAAARPTTRRHWGQVQ